MKSVNIHEAKTHLSRLVEAAARGEEVIIAKAGRPMARLVPLEPPSMDVSKRIGFLKGSGLDEWWDSLDHEVLDREIAESFEGSRIFPDESDDDAGGNAA